jgi:protein-S-isoprenylcysteine O-methyltransferase Ste14
LILIVAIYLYVQHVKYDLAFNYSLWEWICLGVCVLGLLIRIYCIGHSHDNTSGRNTDEGQIADAVNQSGLYAAVRHPLYLGNFFMWLGLAMFTANIWFVIAFIFLFWVYYERIMFAEEEYLRTKFGDRYTTWALHTPAFIPDLSKWSKPHLSFSWRKVIRQEKAGILNLFLVIWLFKAVASFILNGRIQIDDKKWTYGLLAVVGWYVVIKVLQKVTKVFERDR